MPSSDRFLDTVFATASPLPILTLLEATIDGVGHYYVNNTQSVTSTVSGSPQNYQRASFEISLPEDTGEGTPTATLDFDVADIAFIRLLRQTESRIQLRLWLVLADDLNTVEFGPAEYESVEFSLAANSVSVSLEADSSLDIQLPGLRYTPNVFPELWANNV